MTDRPERRKHPRVALKGAALLFAGDYAQRARILNLGEGGMLGETLVTVPSRQLGRAVDIELRLDDGLAQWMRIDARVVRITPGRVALTFERVPAALVRLTNEMVRASAARKRVLSVVLIDSNDERRHRIGESFRNVGCVVVEAGLPLEAIVRLGEASFEPDMILVADSVPELESQELRLWIERAHPRVKLVSIHDEAQKSDAAMWLSAADPDDDIGVRIRDLLARPLR